MAAQLNYIERLSPEDGRYYLTPGAGRLSRRALARFLSDAREAFEPFGVNFGDYGPPEIAFHDMLTAEVVWAHRLTGAQLKLSEVWFDRKTGAINQYGSNYGALTL